MNKRNVFILITIIVTILVAYFNIKGPGYKILKSEDGTNVIHICSLGEYHCSLDSYEITINGKIIVKKKTDDKWAHYFFSITKNGEDISIKSWITEQTKGNISRNEYREIINAKNYNVRIVVCGRGLFQMYGKTTIDLEI